MAKQRNARAIGGASPTTETAETSTRKAAKATSEQATSEPRDNTAQTSFAPSKHPSSPSTESANPPKRAPSPPKRPASPSKRASSPSKRLADPSKTPPIPRQARIDTSHKARSLPKRKGSSSPLKESPRPKKVAPGPKGAYSLAKAASAFHKAVPSAAKASPAPMKTSATVRGDTNGSTAHAAISAAVPRTPATTGGLIEHRRGDLFLNPPRGTVLIHSCNCQGAWGSGIAASFKTRYDAAYQIYRNFCAAIDDKAKLLGSALLIVTPKSPMIGCLFTSVGVGKKKSSRETIVSATSTALQDLCAQLLELVPEGQQAQRREFGCHRSILGSLMFRGN